MIKSKEGGCYCKAIRFRTTGEPAWVGVCYCVDCRKISGSPYIVFAGYLKNQIEMLHGTPHDFASSENVRRSFCTTCSSPFSYRYVDDKTETQFIPVGVFDDPSGFKITNHIWVKQKLPWIQITDDAPQEQ